MALRDLSRKPHEKMLPIRMLKTWLAAALWLGCAGLAQAAGPAASVEHARIRWLPGDLPLAGYFDLSNTGRHPFTLTGASSPAFGGVMMHRTTHRGGQAEMAPAGKLEVRPGQSLHFAPDGYHLMLMDRTRPLAVGDHVPIRLLFSGGGAMDVMFTVRGADMQ